MYSTAEVSISDIRCSYIKLKSSRNYIVYKWVKCTVNVVSQCPGGGGGAGKNLVQAYVFFIFVSYASQINTMSNYEVNMYVMQKGYRNKPLSFVCIKHHIYGIIYYT
jgi:hypothetical protein